MMQQDTGVKNKTRVIQQSVFINDSYDRFFYDLEIPAYDNDLENNDTQYDVEQVTNEVLVDDIYRLGFYCKPGDVWVDAGSHTGLFSIGVIQAGGDVACMIDEDRVRAWCSWNNVVAFQRQLMRRNYTNSVPIVPAVLNESIVTAERLVEASMLPFNAWRDKKRTCLKLDIQGSERQFLTKDGLWLLAGVYDFMVFEWHYSDTAELLSMMDAVEWDVCRVQRHTDVLSGELSCIIWAYCG